MFKEGILPFSYFKNRLTGDNPRKTACGKRLPGCRRCKAPGMKAYFHVLRMPGNAADTVPCERLRSPHPLEQGNNLPGHRPFSATPLPPSTPPSCFRVWGFSKAMAPRVALLNKRDGSIPADRLRRLATDAVPECDPAHGWAPQGFVCGGRRGGLRGRRPRPR